MSKLRPIRIVAGLVAAVGLAALTGCNPAARLGVAKAANIEGYVSAMPAYEGFLGDEEIVAVLSWIKSQWPAEIRAQHDEANQQARQRAAP